MKIVDPNPPNPQKNRKTPEERVKALENKLSEAKAKLSQKNRRRRTAELIVLGLLLQRGLIQFGGSVDGWRKIVPQTLAPREAEKALSALVEIEKVRSQRAADSPGNQARENHEVRT